MHASTGADYYCRSTWHLQPTVTLAAKLSRDVLTTTLVKASLKVRGVVVIPLLTISLGAAAYGAYVQVLAVSVLLSQVATLGLDTGIVQFVQQHEDDRAAAYWTGASTVLVAGAACSAAVAALAWPLAAVTLGTAEYGTAFLVGSVLVTLTVEFRYAQGYLRATRRIGLYAATDAAQVYLQVAAVAGAVLLTDWGIAGVLAAVVAARGLVVAMMHAAIVAEVGVAAPSPDRLRRYLRYSLPTMGTDVARSALTRADRIVVGALLGAAAVGVYTVAYQVARLLLLYVRPLSITLFPEFSRLWTEDRDRVRTLGVTGLRYFLAIAVPSVAGFWLIGEPLLRLLTTPDTAAAASPLLVLLAVGILLQGVAEIYTQLFYAAGETGVPLRIQAGSALANVLLNLALLPLVGLVGAALATIATFGLAALGTAAAVQDRLAVVPSSDAVLVPLLATGVMTATFGIAGLPWPLTLALAPPVYAAVFVLAGGVERSELAGLYRQVTG